MRYLLSLVFVLAGCVSGFAQSFPGPGPGNIGRCTSTDTDNFVARLSTVPSDGRKQQYCRMIKVLVDAGVWAKLDALYIFAAVDESTALTNLISSSYGATNSSATFTTDVGYTGGTSKYVTTNFNPTTATTPNYVQDSASVFMWESSTAAIAGAGVGEIASTATRIYGRYPGNVAIWRVNGSSDITPASTDGSGLWAATRSASNLQTLYRNGASFDTSAAVSAAVPNDNIVFLTATSDFYTGTVYMGGIGGNLSSSDVSTLYGAVHQYLQGVAGIP